MSRAVSPALHLLLSIVFLASAESAYANPAAMNIDSVEFAGSHMEILGKQFDRWPTIPSW